TFLISPDGTRVVYTADEDVDGVIQLYSLPIAGGSAQVSLGILKRGGSTIDPDWIRVSPDGATVFYVADPQNTGVFELYRTLIDGSSPPVKISAPLDSVNDVTSFALTARGVRFLYRADQDVDEQFELYALQLVSQPSKGPAVPPGISRTV